MLLGFSDLEGNVQPPVYFPLGLVVKHQLYHYRGVIVGIDRECAAGNNWYQANKTQPARNQPWYHVLVDDSGGLSTYVAQSNLWRDLTGLPIIHPRVASYFTEFKDGIYISHLGDCLA